MATTKAIAKSRLWVRLISKFVRPSCSARARAAPCRRTKGFPRLLFKISSSRQLMPRIPVPNALDMASFPANLTANSSARFRLSFAKAIKCCLYSRCLDGVHSGSDSRRLFVANDLLTPFDVHRRYIPNHYLKSQSVGGELEPDVFPVTASCLYK